MIVYQENKKEFLQDVRLDLIEEKNREKSQGSIKEKHGT